MYLFEKLNLNNIASEYGLEEIEFSKLNIFVGANNSGKSRVIRKVLNTKNEDYLFKNNSLTIFPEKKFPLDRVNYLKLNETQQKVIKEMLNEKGYLRMGVTYREFLEKIDEVGPNRYQNTTTNVGGRTIDTNKEREKLVSYLEEIKLNKWEDNQSLKKIYIPILRGMRKIGDGNYYKSRTIEDYFNKELVLEVSLEQKEKKLLEEKKLEIQTGLEIYSKCKAMLLGSSNERKNIDNFQKFLSEEFFDNKEVLLMPREGEVDLHIKIGEEPDFPIYNLGDGIQSMLMLTFPLFENSGKQMLIGIEEPEIYLHPGAQRKLMEVLLDKDGKYGFEKFQYLITTHSNHFLDLTLDYPEDVMVYESRKIENRKFEIAIKNDENMLELMGSLGVRNSSVFLANSTIWVEGITDRLYLKKYMEVYQREMLFQGKLDKVYEEDKHYSFVEYSGGNITHWDFLDEEEGMKSSQISNNIFLIADTDGHRDKITQAGEKTKKRERIEKLESLTEISTYLLECKEIENLLTPKIIRKVLDEKGEEIDSLDFNQDDYKEEGIGKYIETTLLNRQEAKKKYEADSGTIKDKVNFCRIACKYIDNLDDLSEETRIICEKLYNFIAEANGKVRSKSTSQADEALSEEVS